MSSAIVLISSAMLLRLRDMVYTKIVDFCVACMHACLLYCPRNCRNIAESARDSFTQSFSATRLRGCAKA